MTLSYPAIEDVGVACYISKPVMTRYQHINFGKFTQKFILCLKWWQVGKIDMSTLSKLTYYWKTGLKQDDALYELWLGENTSPGRTIIPSFVFFLPVRCTVGVTVRNSYESPIA